MGFMSGFCQTERNPRTKGYVSYATRLCCDCSAPKPPQVMQRCDEESKQRPSALIINVAGQQPTPIEGGMAFASYQPASQP